jgi:CHAD domain-containing protein
MADGKWIHGLTPETPLVEAARHVLSLRLQVVREYLPRAVFESERDPENVHQLRVGTRRADAALRIFRDCLAGKVYRSTRAGLRGLRQAAGQARDWDVFLLELRKRASQSSAEDRPGLDFLMGYAQGQRAVAQAQLQEADLSGEGFEAVAAEALAQLQPPEGGGALLELARGLLGRRLRNLHRAAAGDLKDYDQLHQVRIAGKRLRYAMEVFVDCFAPEFRDRLYPKVEEMQEILGRANDSHVAAQRLGTLREQLRHREEWERLRPGIEGLLRFHQRRLPQERRRFLKWWEDWRQSGAEAVLAGTPALS